MARNDGRAEVQHYVPRVLLRGFLREPQSKKQVFVFDKHKGHSFHTNIGNIVAERGFYNFDIDGVEGDIEGILSELEGNTKSAFDRLIETENLRVLDEEQLAWLSVFISTQQLRTRHFRDVIQALNNGFAEHIQGLGFDPNATEGFTPLETENDLKLASLEQLALSMREHSSLFSTKACYLAKTTPDNPFWISDNPVVMHNSRDFGPYGNIGLAVPGIEIYMPLTSTLLLAFWCPTNADALKGNVERRKADRERLSALKVLGHNVDRKKIERQLDHIQAVLNDGEPILDALMNGTALKLTEENVLFFNHLQVKWSGRHVISSKDNFNLVKKMINDDAGYRGGLMPTFN